MRREALSDVKEPFASGR